MIIANFVGRILILPGFSFAGSWQEIVLFQWIFGTVLEAEQSYVLIIVTCRNSYLACGFVEFWGVALRCSRDCPVFQHTLVSRLNTVTSFFGVVTPQS